MTRKRKRRPAPRTTARQRQRKQRQRLAIAVVAAVVIGLIGGLIWLNTRPVSLAAIDTENPPNVDGPAWGPTDAPVVIQEWSDFG